MSLMDKIHQAHFICGRLFRRLTMSNRARYSFAAAPFFQLAVLLNTRNYFFSENL